jgi:hypothetical protein
MNKILILALVASAMPALAGTSKNPVAPVEPPPAPGLSYDFVAVGYNRGFSDVGSDTDAIGAAFSMSFTENLFGQVGAGLSGVDGLDDFSASALVGAHVNVIGDVDFILGAGAAYADSTDEDVAFISTAALRSFIGPVDASVGVNYADFGGGSWTGFVALWVPITEQLDIGINGGIDLENSDNYTLGGGFRYRFQ